MQRSVNWWIRKIIFPRIPNIIPAFSFTHFYFNILRSSFKIIMKWISFGISVFAYLPNQLGVPETNYYQGPIQPFQRHKWMQSEKTKSVYAPNFFTIHLSAIGLLYHWIQRIMVSQLLFSHLMRFSKINKLHENYIQMYTVNILEYFLATLTNQEWEFARGPHKLEFLAFPVYLLLSHPGLSLKPKRAKNLIQLVNCRFL